MTGDRHQLRTMVRGAYDIQKLRISVGNRIAGNFKAKLGQEPGEKEVDLEKEAKAILEVLRLSYTRITDGIAERGGKLNRKKFTGDEVISTYTEFCLVAEYERLRETEEKHFRDLGHVLDDFPIFTEFLKGVKGCGPAMSGVIIGEFDIHKARYVSSLWAYAGLDAVTYYERIGAFVEPAPERINKRHPERDGEPYYFRPTGYREFEDVEGRVEILTLCNDGGETLGEYRKINTGQGRSRRKDHLVDREYTTKDGEIETRKSITFNPFLKTKLVGVLAGCFMRAGGPYRAIYDEYKVRLVANPKWSEATKGRIHAAAMRYMVKMFLRDLYVAWRPLEGLEVHPSYDEAKRRQSEAQVKAA